MLPRLVMFATFFLLISKLTGLLQISWLVVASPMLLYLASIAIIMFILGFVAFCLISGGRIEMRGPDDEQ